MQFSESSPAAQEAINATAVKEEEEEEEYDIPGEVENVIGVFDENGKQCKV